MGRPLVLLPVILAALLSASCADPFGGQTLSALPVAEAPTEADWAKAVPLHLTVWRGNVHMRPEVAALDQETSHKSTAACHHGSENSTPVPVGLLALWSPEEIFLRAEWEDPTPDGSWGRWEEKAGTWTPVPEADDGIAVMWGEEGEGEFRCQRNCHMTDVGISDGSTLMQMKMLAPQGRRYDLWRARMSLIAGFGRADDMVVEEKGKRGDEGQVLPRENISPDGSRPLEREKSEGGPVPYYLPEEPREREGQVRAAAGTPRLWRNGSYTITLRRRLDTLDPDDRPFRPGGEVPFSLAVFDHTFREHHVASGSFRLRLLAEPGCTRQEVERDPMDF